LREGEIGMMREQVKKLDKNHLEMIHLDTCSTVYKSLEGMCLNTNWVTLHDMLEK
jgi:hypothetical protein